MKILCVIEIYLVSFAVCHAVRVVIQLHWTIFHMGELRLALELVLDLHTIQNWMHCIQLLRCNGIPWIWCITHKPLVNEDSLCHGKWPHCTWNSDFKRWFSIAMLEYNRVNPMKIQCFMVKPTMIHSKLLLFPAACYDQYIWGPLNAAVTLLSRERPRAWRKKWHRWKGQVCCKGINYITRPNHIVYMNLNLNLDIF